MQAHTFVSILIADDKRDSYNTTIAIQIHGDKYMTGFLCMTAVHDYTSNTIFCMKHDMK